MNWEADKRPGDPTAISDPACWITASAAEALKTELTDRIQMLRHAPWYQVDGVLDISDETVVGVDGKLCLKSQLSLSD